jgi:hypothetical protein
VRVDLIEEADEFLMPMALHVAADNGAVEDIEGGAWSCRCACSRASSFRRDPASSAVRLGAVESLDLAGEDRAARGSRNSTIR